MFKKDAGSGVSSRGLVLYISVILLFFLAYTHRIIPTVIAVDLLKEFSISASGLGFMLSGYFYGYAISQPIVGVLTDRIGPKRVLSIFAAIATLGIIISALSPTALWMFFGRLLIGFGAGGDWVPSLKIISLFFKPRRHGFLTGIVSAGGLSGGIIATAPYAALVEVLAWRNSFFLLAGITLILAIVVLVFGSSDKGEMNKEKKHSDTLNKTESWSTSLKACLKMSVFWYIAMLLLLMGAVLMTFQGLWGVPFFIDIYSLSRVSASKIIMILSIGFVISSLLFGYLIDKYESLQGAWLIAGHAIVSGCFALLAIFPDKLSLTGLTVICFLIGFGFGSLVCIFKITPKVFSPHVYATSVGFVNIFSFLGTLIYQPMTGLIMDKFGIENTHYSLEAYRLVFLLLSLSIFVSVIVSILMRNYTTHLTSPYPRN